MAILRTYRCPACQGVFDFLHHPSGDPPPRFCPLCGFDTNEEALEKAPVAPHVVRRATVDSVDQTYAQMEAGSDKAVEAAARMAGCDPSEMASLRITDMPDSLKEGDIATKPVVNDVTRFMDAHPAAPVGALNGGQGYGAGTATGPFPYAGFDAVRALRSNHAKAPGAFSSQTPSLEVLRGLGVAK